MRSDMDMSDDDLSAVDSSTVQIAPLPRISIQAFCESAEVSNMIESVITDRRMIKAHIKVQAGGPPVRWKPIARRRRRT